MADDAEKLSHKDAGYGPGLPHCAVCKHYSEESEAGESPEGADEGGHCDLVEDPIEESGWCKLFVDRRNRTLAAGRKSY